MPLLPHYILHSVARSIDLGVMDAALVVQTGPGGMAGVALVSPVAVGRHNMAPRARLALLASLPGVDARPLQDFAVHFERALPKKKEPAVVVEGAVEIEEEPLPDLPEIGAITRLAVSGKGPVDLDGFPALQRLEPESPAEGDLFLLDALVSQLEASKERWGLLLSLGEQGACLATLVERL
jgi:hypothetical protein